MFGIGMPEMLLILAVALIVIGPKKLPDLAKSLGRAMGEFKKATSDIKQSMEMDAGFGEVKSTFNGIKDDIRDSVAGGDTEAYQPTAADTDADADAGADADAENGQVESREKPDVDAAMSDLKTAFDDMNQDQAAPTDTVEDAAEASSENLEKSDDESEEKEKTARG